LALYASGRTTGLVVDSGDGVTHVVVVYDGYSIKHATKRLDLAGRTLTEFMMKHLTEDGYSFKSTAEKEIAKKIKEEVCYVPLDYKAEIEKFISQGDEMKKKFEMPDGSEVFVGNL
jgi:actin-related protein